jgi:outer membrane protein OmpA-like peptidoglycan-associated protein
MTIKHAILALGLVAAFSVTAGAQTSFAQQVDKENIVRALAPKKAARTRSLSVRPRGPDARTRALIRDIANGRTRAITVEARKKITTYVKQAKAPSIDLVVYFDYNSAVIRQDSYKVLFKLGQALTDKRLKGVSFLVAGHTDATGSNQYNLALSHRRALAVKTFLAQHFGVAAAKLVAVGYGEEQLKNKYDPASGDNRRVQITNLLVRF